mmetsp:Transcript_72553/g.208276  ORF Transcript_72553/g.208276 Transcript_72553/m.208276 type:complete len:287 (-) Transcript_72553:55-915(-)
MRTAAMYMGSPCCAMACKPLLTEGSDTSPQVNPPRLLQQFLPMAQKETCALPASELAFEGGPPLSKIGAAQYTFGHASKPAALSTSSCAPSAKCNMPASAYASPLSLGSTPLCSVNFEAAIQGSTTDALQVPKTTAHPIVRKAMPKGSQSSALTLPRWPLPRVGQLPTAKISADTATTIHGRTGMTWSARVKEATTRMKRKKGRYAAKKSSWLAFRGFVKGWFEPAPALGSAKGSPGPNTAPRGEGLQSTRRATPHSSSKLRDMAADTAAAPLTGACTQLLRKSLH